MKVCHVDFTNWSFYCPTKNSIDHVVFIHNVKSHQCGDLVQFLHDMSVFVCDCLFIPTGELKIVNSMEMLLNIVVFDGVKYHKLLTKAQRQFTKQTHKELVKEREIWTYYGMACQKFLFHVIDELISQEFNSDNMQESDLVYKVDLVCHDHYSDEDTVIINHEQYDRQPNCDIVDSVRHLNNASILDVNITRKNRAFLATTVKQFEFIGLDRCPQKFESVSDYIAAAQIIKDTGLPNYRQARIPVISDLNIAAWEEYLADYPDPFLLQYIKFGFPLSLIADCRLSDTQVHNHFSANQHPDSVQDDLDKEIQLGAILGPVDKVEFEGFHCSPLSHRWQQEADNPGSFIPKRKFS